jgi:hypothetical protein
VRRPRTPLDDSFVWGVADLAPTDAWAVGEAIGSAMVLPFVERWDGAGWRPVQLRGPGIGKLTAVAASGPDDVWMTGTRYDNAFQYPRPLVARWDGRRLRLQHIAKRPHGHSVEIEGVAAGSPGEVWVVGTHGAHGQTYLPLIEHYDGTGWTVVAGDPAQGRNADLSGVATDSATDAWSVGWYLQPGHTTISAYAQHWDGSAWTQSSMPLPGYASYLTSVSVVAPDDVWAAGSWLRTIRDSTSRPLLEHWDGKAWNVVPAPHRRGAGTSVESVSLDGPEDGFAVGESAKDGRATAYSISWDGTSWTRR